MLAPVHTGDVVIPVCPCGLTGPGRIITATDHVRDMGSWIYKVAVIADPTAPSVYVFGSDVTAA